MPLDRCTDVARIIELVAAGTLTNAMARQVVSGVLAGEGRPTTVVAARGLAVVQDADALGAACDAAIAGAPDIAEKVRGGKARGSRAAGGRRHEGDAGFGRRVQGARAAAGEARSRLSIRLARAVSVADGVSVRTYRAGVPHEPDGSNAPAGSFAPSAAKSRKPRSYEVTQGVERAPARAMLRAVGMGDADWDKFQIGVGSSWNEVTPCNLPLQRLAAASKEGVHAAGGFPLEFGTIAVVGRHLDGPRRDARLAGVP